MMDTVDDVFPDLSKVDWDDLGPSRNAKKATENVGVKVDVVSDLLNGLRSKKNLDAVKKQLKVGKKKKGKVLDTPLHRQAQTRISAAVAYRDTAKEVSQWREIVHENRVADQLVYPLNPEESALLLPERTADKVKAFKPQTELEKQMAEILGTSKYVLKNDDVYTEAELEIIKAMSVKEARERCQKLQAIRRLTSYREAKYRRESKIKSKAYHRIKKRQQRREAIKAFEELLAKDPVAAAEKLKELETDRAYERAVLRHRTKNKFAQDLRKYASRDPNVEKTLEDHLSFGRELKQKVGRRTRGLEDSSDDSDDEVEDSKALGLEEILQLAADDATEPGKADERTIGNAETNPWLKDAVARKKKAKAAAQNATVISEDDFAKRRAGKPIELAKMPEPEFEVPTDNGFGRDFEVVADLAAGTLVNASQGEEKKVSPRKKNPERKATNVNIDDLRIEDLFGEVEKRLSTDAIEPFKKTAKRKAKKICDSDSDEAKGPGKPGKKKAKKQLAPKKTDAPAEAPGIDLRTFLQATSGGEANSDMPADLEAALGEAEDQDIDRDNILAEAFADDDVVEDFETQKNRVADDEDPFLEEIDITQRGWGSWTGPGFDDQETKADRKKKSEAKKKARRDTKLAHVIIKENIENPITKIQPQSVPYPYNSASNFEAVIRQPIGRDWNLVHQTEALTQPEIIAPAGRIIRPMSKAALDEHRALQRGRDAEDDDDEE